MRFIEIYLKHKEGFNYLIFGFLTTVLNLVIYYLLTNTILNPNIEIELQIANVLSWLVAFLFAYITNRLFVFQSKNDNVLKEFSKFFLSRISTLILDMIIMFIGVSVLKYNDQIIKLISQVLVILSNYILSKIFVFKK